MPASRLHRSAPGRCAARRNLCATPAHDNYTVRIVIKVAALILIAALQVTASDPNNAQAERAERRIRALQAEADRLAAQSRTVFGDLRKLEIDRAIKQEELTKAERELARVTIDRDTTAKRLAALEATRVAGTP